MVKKTAKDSAAAPADAAAGAPEAEEWVRVDAQGEPLADQGPTEEEVRARLMAANRAHTETLGDAWAVLTGQNPEAVMGQIAATVMHEGGTRPAWQWKREGQDHVLLAWPQDQPVRAAVLVAGEEGGKLRPVSAAPLLDGLPNDLTVEDVHPWKTGVDANVAVSRGRGQLADRFYDRVMFPIFDEQGHNIAFGGRIMGDGQPKYLNTAETSVFHKKRNLYGFNWAKEFIVAQDTAIVVEGYTDCIACWEAGIKNVVATLGTALTEHHVKTLTRFAKRIVYMFDGDAAGQKAARRAIQFIEQDSMDLRCVVLPDGNDPMEFITAHGGEALQARIDAAEPLMDFVYRSLQESSGTQSP